MGNGEASLTLEQLPSKLVFCIISNVDFCFEQKSVIKMKLLNSQWSINS